MEQTIAWYTILQHQQKLVAGCSICADINATQILG